MDSCELTLGITALANAIACELSADDLDLIGAVFTQLGDTLTTISVRRARGGGKADAGLNAAQSTSKEER